MMENDDGQTLDWKLIEKIFNQAKTQRLGNPYSLLTPKPYHFPVGSKYKGVAVTLIGPASDSEMKLLYSYGMPKATSYIVATVSAAIYGNEFADFTLEYFGLISERINIEAINVREGEQWIAANVDRKEFPLNAGMEVTLAKEDFSITLLAWRLRIFMNESSLCLENLYHRAIGWIPCVLGIKYDNPEKTVTDMSRFAPACRLYNVIKAKLGERRGGAQYSKVNATDKERKELGKEYLKVKKDLKNIRTEYNGYIKQKKDWRSHLRTDYSVFIEYPDVLEKMDDPDKPKYTPSNLAIEIAARRSIKTYKSFSVTAKRLKELKILPKDNAK